MHNDLIGILEKRASAHPEKLLFAFHDVNGAERERFTYASFLGRARFIANALRQAGIGCAEPVLLVYPPGLEMAAAFFASAMVGAIPVPAPPPSQSWQPASWIRLLHIASSAGAARVLSTTAFSRQVAGASASGGDLGKLQNLEWISTDAMAGQLSALQYSTSKILFIQYTSGSTSAPRGVAVTHANAIHNGRLSLPKDPQIGVSWLPHFHDMGLLGYFVFCIVNGGTSHLFAPIDFLRRPALWFELISRTGATMTTAPNSAYEYCLREDKLPEAQLAGIDLSTLRSMVNCAEPVRAATFERFYSRFSRFGLPRRALVAGYGLAEHTLCVTTGGFRTIERLLPGTALQRFVSCGTPATDVDVKVVDPDTLRPLREREIGEIWTDSPSKAAGYWRMPVESRLHFEAHITEGDKEKSYLRTGDLGFFDKGELFVCGRLRDMLIIDGRNVFPADIEAAIEQRFPKQLAGRVAAFGAGGNRRGTEELVLLVEAGPNVADLATLRLLVQQSCAVAADSIVRVPRGTIIRTSSGKIARRLCRQKWEAGEISVLETLRTGNPGLEDMVARLASDADALGGRDTTLGSLGLDSIALVNLSLALEQLLEEAGLATAERMEQAADMSLIQSLRVCDLESAFAAFRASAEGSAAVVAMFDSMAAKLQQEERSLMRADTEVSLPLLETSGHHGPDVLLTGATGFLGSFLLKSLLKAVEGRIIVVARSSKTASATQRVRQSLLNADCPPEAVDEAMRSRIEILEGDLRQPRLGLDTSAWEDISNRVGRIYHCGAEVDYVKSYAMLRTANVLATRDILELAATGCPKSLHYISTTFVFGWSAKLRLLETDSNPEMDRLDFGYAQSKWVAEQLVQRARLAGFPVTVHRPSLVTASLGGRFVRRDIAARALGYMIRHGITVDTKNQISFVPVDVCAHNIVALSFSKNEVPPVLHITSDGYHNAADICETITRSHGYRFRQLSLPDFVAHAHTHCGPEDDLFPLLSFFDRNTKRILAMGAKRYDSTSYRKARDDEPLARQHPSDAATVSAIVTFLAREGLVPEPLAGSQTESRLAEATT